MNRLKEKLQHFMIGRYGYDQLSQCILWVILALVVVNLLVRASAASMVLSIAETALFVVLYFRIFSKNGGKRFQENQRFLALRFYAAERWKKISFRFSRNREYRFFKCPGCSQRIRIPRGHGKVSIHCPRCGNDFIKKT